MGVPPPGEKQLEALESLLATKCHVILSPGLCELRQYLE